MKTGIAAAARAAARNRTLRRVGMTAALAAGRRAEPIARERYGAWRDRRIDRDRAIKLARQVGGRISEGTIIAGTPHFVVWRNGRPVDAFPHVPDLETRPELRSFDAGLTRDPTAPARRVRLPGR